MEQKLLDEAQKIIPQSKNKPKRSGRQSQSIQNVSYIRQQLIQLYEYWFNSCIKSTHVNQKKTGFAHHLLPFVCKPVPRIITNMTALIWPSYRFLMCEQARHLMNGKNFTSFSDLQLSFLWYLAKRTPTLVMDRYNINDNPIPGLNVPIKDTTPGCVFLPLFGELKSQVVEELKGKDVIDEKYNQCNDANRQLQGIIKQIQSHPNNPVPWAQFESVYGNIIVGCSSLKKLKSNTRKKSSPTPLPPNPISFSNNQNSSIPPPYLSAVPSTNPSTNPSTGFGASNSAQHKSSNSAQHKSSNSAQHKSSNSAQHKTHTDPIAQKFNEIQRFKEKEHKKPSLQYENSPRTHKLKQYQGLVQQGLVKQVIQNSNNNNSGDVMHDDEIVMNVANYSMLYFVVTFLFTFYEPMINGIIKFSQKAEQEEDVIEFINYLKIYLSNLGVYMSVVPDLQPTTRTELTNIMNEFLKALGDLRENQWQLDSDVRVAFNDLQEWLKELKLIQ